MADLQVSTGFGARNALCSAFDSARESISAEFNRLSDTKVIASLNAAAVRGVAVDVQLEGMPDRYDRIGRPGALGAGSEPDDPLSTLRAQLSPLVHLKIADDPLVLLHAKLAIVDHERALMTTANQTASGFGCPGEVLVSDTNPLDVGALQHALDRRDGESGPHVASGPGPQLRARLDPLFQTPADLSIAMEDLSDANIVARLESRRAAGHHDRILLNARTTVSRTQARVIRDLENAGVAVHCLAGRYMHNKYIDAGCELFVGSANLTRNGLDEAREVGVFAQPTDFADGATALRVQFERDWESSVPVRLRGCAVQAWEKDA
ncbi:MAG: phospholipase D-like domain-containing protein [Candidatus Eremiobacteraeota bacterium]|nr:phospholipase D-like domain-containing protein [Candidatus Eremiobacteraeota bacterium]